jgi:hypothetical protein
MIGMFIYGNDAEPEFRSIRSSPTGRGGYFEPGLSLRPFGFFQGVAVSG